jgi:hypothetical protein
MSEEEEEEGFIGLLCGLPFVGSWVCLGVNPGAILDHGNGRFV